MPSQKEREMQKEMEVEQLLHMNGGEDKDSYAQNSLLQKLIIQKVKHVVEQSIKELCSFEDLPECINIADLGCSSGPNAFLSIEEIINNIVESTRKTNRTPPSIHVFLNDLVGNDFNSLFKLLPGFYERIGNGGESSRSRRSCFVTAIPGSFYGSLFPENSVHFVHSSYSLMWLSQVPAGLVSEIGEPLNKRNMCWSRNTSPPIVRAAYSDQFNKDFTMFLRMRSQEMAVPGCLALTIMSKNDEIDGCDGPEFLGSAIDELVKQGLIEASKLATFNLPLYTPTEQEIRDAVDAEGSFKLNHLENFKLLWDAGNISKNGQTLQCRGEHVATFMRAVFEPLLASHFGESIMDDLFSCHAKKVAEYFEMGKGIVSTIVISLSKKGCL